MAILVLSHRVPERALPGTCPKRACRAQFRARPGQLCFAKRMVPRLTHSSHRVITKPTGTVSAAKIDVKLLEFQRTVW